MPNRLAHAASPYLLSHADNPVDWWQWGPEPFAEAARRDVPVLVSIGYSTCHWCHVMARESFSDPELAAYLNANFVAIKVDREEHAEVDATYLAAAAAFTRNLGWPLNVFVTPQGRAFFAGTYWPPEPVGAHPAFRQVLDGVLDAWRLRRPELERNGEIIAEVLAQAVEASPTEVNFSAAVGVALELEDPVFGGFGGAPKFPVVPVIRFLLDRGAAGDATAGALAERTLDAMAASELRDLDGGFFRYSTQRDWTEPHYERMLYDNAQLVAALALADRETVAAGVADFLLSTLQLPEGGFASAQDSESSVGGSRGEGVYYALDATARAGEAAPALDEKVLTGWNGLAIEALAVAGARLGRSDWIDSARRAAEFLLEHHVVDGLIRASIGGRVSTARATLEDYGMFAGGLLQLALATGEVRFAASARDLVDGVLAAGAADGVVFAVPGGGDPVLSAQGLHVAQDVSDGAHPSGLASIAAAAVTLYQLTGDRLYRDSASAAMVSASAVAGEQPISHGAALGVLSSLAEPVRQLVVVTDDSNGAMATLARRWRGGPVAILSSAQTAEWAEHGFDLFSSRAGAAGATTAYLCEDFSCRLPVDSLAALADLLD